MLFPRRRWAIRVVEKAGFPIGSQEATLLIDLLIWASKQDPKQVPPAEGVLISALRMVHNQTAVLKVADELAVSLVAAENALARLPQAAIAVAAEHGMNEFVKIATRKLGEANKQESLHEQAVISGLRIIKQLEPTIQRAIADRVSAFINIANVGGDVLLEQFFASAGQERCQAVSDGASQMDPRWVEAVLKETWCAAKLLKGRGGTITAASMDSIIQEIEHFAFG